MLIAEEIKNIFRNSLLIYNINHHQLAEASSDRVIWRQTIPPLLSTIIEPNVFYRRGRIALLLLTQTLKIHSAVPAVTGNICHKSVRNNLVIFVI